MASNFPRSEGDKSAPEAAGEVAVHPETWLDVDIGAGEVATHPDTWPDFTAYGGFNDSADAQQKLVEYLAPGLVELRIKLCPGRMSESDFRETLFVRLHPEKEDSLILSNLQTVKVPASLSTRGTSGVPGQAVVSLAREFIIMNRKTGLNFPLDDDEDDDFNLSDAQQEHVLAVQELVPRLDILRTLLCPDHKSESLFWKSYFVHIYPKLEKEDALLLSTPQLVKAWAKAMSMEGDNSARNAIGVTDKVVSFAKHMARYPEAWFDYLLLDGDVYPDFKMSEAYQKHALAINHLVPSLAALRLELCNCRMSESCFWKIYFVHIHPILEEDAKQLSTSQILKVWANLSTELQELRKRIMSMDEERPSPDQYPWLMICHNLPSNEEDNDVQTFYNVGTEKEYITKYYNISGIHASQRGFGGLKVCASCCGWIILVSQFSGSCFLLDVLSMEKVRLPKIPSLDMVPDTYSRKNYFVMTAAPTDRDCLVGLFSATKRSFLIWRPGRHKWSELSYKPHVLSDVAVCRGTIYCVVDDQNCGICRIIDDRLSVFEAGTYVLNT